MAWLFRVCHACYAFYSACQDAAVLSFLGPYAKAFDICLAVFGIDGVRRCIFFLAGRLV